MAVVSSRTKYFKSRDLPSEGALPGVLIRLMMAINDVSLAADADVMWVETLEQRRAHRKNRARTYFVRLIMSHVHEALAIVSEIDGNAELRAAVDKCDARTRANFTKLVALLKSPERGHLYRFRTKTTFHYDKAIPRDTLKKVVEHDPDAVWGYSVGSRPLDWHYQIADAVVDRMVVRYVLGADEPNSPARRKKVEEIALRLDEVVSLLTEFATHFIQRSLR